MRKYLNCHIDYGFQDCVIFLSFLACFILSPATFTNRPPLVLLCKFIKKCYTLIIN